MAGESSDVTTPSDVTAGEESCGGSLLQREGGTGSDVPTAGEAPVRKARDLTGMRRTSGTSVMTVMMTLRVG